MTALLLILLLSGPAMSAPTVPDSLQQYIDRGLKAEAEGEYEQALQIWLNARAELDTPSLAIGRNYIRLATEQGMDKHYQAASAIYLWGLSGEEIGYQKEDLEREVSFLEPLLSDQLRREWNRMLENEDPDLYRQIQRWWKTKDPTPDTPYNERLIEHWQRIAHAREHYTRGAPGVYGADDRGTVYVQFGAPDRMTTGTMDISSMEVDNATDIIGGGQLARAALFLNTDPYYEVWIYQKPDEEMQYNLVILFGDKPAGGFSRLDTIEDLIPIQGFTLSKRYEPIDWRRVQPPPEGIVNPLQPQGGAPPVIAARVSPGMILQWVYFKRLAVADFYFVNQMERMRTTYAMTPGGRDTGVKYLGHRFIMDHKHENVLLLNAAPEEVSTIEKLLPTVPLDIYQYRLLNEQNEPIFATFMESRPQQAFLEDLAFNQDSMFAGLDDSAQVRTMLESYRLYHGVRVRSEEGEVLTGTRFQPTLLIDGSDMQVASGSAFTVPYTGEGAVQQFYAELHNRNDRSAPRQETPFPDYLRGMGKTIVEQPEPLSGDPFSLEMGDLILGYGLKENPSADSFLPFVVSNEQQIPEGEQLALHVELYHLQAGREGNREFRLEYEILPVNFLGWTRERRGRLSLTLNFEHDRPRFTEDLEIEAANLEPGRYVLRMAAIDTNSDQRVEREIHFDVTEREE